MNKLAEEPNLNQLLNCYQTSPGKQKKKLKREKFNKKDASIETMFQNKIHLKLELQESWLKTQT
jgi:hypothetical protein